MTELSSAARISPVMTVPLRRTTAATGEAPEAYVKRVVLAKLDAARTRRTDRKLALRPILSADTTVALGGKLFGKPADRLEAVSMLTRLSGKTHRVLTAMAVSHGEHGQRQLLQEFPGCTRRDRRSTGL